MKKFLLLFFLIGCTQQASVLSSSVSDCLDKGGDYNLSWQGIEGGVCIFSDGQKCFDVDYYSYSGCYPIQANKTLTKCTSDFALDVCSMIYEPVCAKFVENGEVVWKSFSNACSACISGSIIREVKGYVNGSCSIFSVIK